MPFLHIVILALIQGITEFLPVSSSGHLVIAHSLLGSKGFEQDALMDIAVHVGTLGALLIYFRRDVEQMGSGFLALLIRRNKNKQSTKLVLHVMLASLPVILAGYLIHVMTPSWSRSLALIGWMSIIFGFVLWYADKFKPETRTLETFNWKSAVFIGLAQAISLLPGTSRSGITMTAGRWLGFSRTESARFSLLLAMVAISGAGFLGGIDLLKNHDASFGLDTVTAALISFFSSWAVVVLMMKWLKYATFTPFVIYRIALGVFILIALQTGIIS